MQTSLRKIEISAAIAMLLLSILTMIFVAITCFKYFQTFMPNPLFDKRTIVEVTIRKNYIQFLLSLIGLLSGILVLKKAPKNSWLLLTASWLLFTAFSILNFIRLILSNYHNDLIGWMIMFIIIFTIISTLLVQTKFISVYKPSKKDWIMVAISIGFITICKITYS